MTIDRNFEVATQKPLLELAMKKYLNVSKEDEKLWTETAKKLTGSDQRIFMARVVLNLGTGAKFYAEKVLNWNRGTIRKGTRELELGPELDKRVRNSGRKPLEFHLPNLIENIKSIVAPYTQTDPTFQSLKQYCPLTAKYVLSELSKILSKRSKWLPTSRTINNKLRDLGILPVKVKKSKPLKKIPETDDIFNKLKEVNATGEDDKESLRISLDAKATIKIGEFSRGGYSRGTRPALDHDFAPDALLKLFGILLPDTGESHLWFTESNVTADFMCDCIERMIIKERKRRVINKLIINADNGPENSSRRTQWMYRLVQMCEKLNVKIELAYYPPYHSKYNPVERLWGVMENYWNGELLDSIPKVLSLARTMTYREQNPKVSLLKKKYKLKVKLSKGDMIDEVENKIKRHDGLEDWFVKIG